MRLTRCLKIRLHLCNRALELELTAGEFEVTDVSVERVESKIHATADNCHVTPNLVVHCVFAADL